MIPTVAHARRHLATPDALVIPAAAKVWAQVVSLPPQPEPIIAPAAASPDDPRASRWSGYDGMRPPEVKKYTSVRLDRVAYRALSEPFPVFGFDFDAPLDDPASTAEYSRECDLAIEASETGTVNAVVFWFADAESRRGAGRAGGRVYLPAMTERCHAKEGTRCWNEALQFVEPAAVTEGKPFTIRAAHSPTRVFFRGVTGG